MRTNSQSTIPGICLKSDYTSVMKPVKITSKPKMKNQFFERINANLRKPVLNKKMTANE